MTDLIESPNSVSEPTPFIEISDPAVLAKIPLVSVKMITYNHAPYIAQAIEGVLQQETSFPVELIIGEDCSTDGTREIVLNFQQKYPNIIRVITSGKNVGAKNNSKRVYKACRGKYIAFCEGDDYWHDTNKINKQVDYLENHSGCGLVYSSYDVYHCKYSKNIKDFIKYREWKIIDSPKLFDFFISLKKKGGSRVGVQTCTVMVRRNLYEQIVESDPYLHNSEHFLMGDTQMWVEMSNIADLHYMQESMATHIITEESATRSKDIKKRLRFSISNAELMIYLCNKYNLPLDVKSKYEKYKYNNLLRLAYYTRNKKLAEEYRKHNNKMNYKEWLRYFGAKNFIFYYIYRAANIFTYIFKKEYDFWQ